MTKTRGASLALSIGGLAAALLWTIIRSGVGLSWVVDDAQAAAAAWPQRLDSWMTGFYTDSPTYVLAVRALGMDTRTEYLRVSAAALAIAMLALVAWALVAARPDGRWRAARLIALTPIAAVLLINIGSYDPYTVLAWALALFAWLSGSRVLIVLGGALLGFQHFEQTLMGAVALLLVWLALRDQLRDPLGRVNPAWLLPGILGGKALLIAILLLSDQTATSRTEWLGEYLTTWTKVAIITGPLLLWSLFAGTWALVIAMWLRNPGWRGRALLLGAFAVGAFATLVSGDRPRVFVLVMLPALAIMIVAFADHSPRGSREAALVETIVWLAPPVMLAGTLVVNANVVDTAIIALFQILGL